MFGLIFTSLFQTGRRAALPGHPAVPPDARANDAPELLGRFRGHESQGLLNRERAGAGHDGRGLRPRRAHAGGGEERRRRDGEGGELHGSAV